MRFDSLGQGTKVVLVPGDKGRWGVVADRLTAHHKVFLVYPDDQGRDLARDALLVREVAGRATYLATRDGAGLCLQLALNDPTIVQKLVISGLPPSFPPAHLVARVGELS